MKKKNFRFFEKKSPLFWKNFKKISKKRGEGGTSKIQTLKNEIFFRPTLLRFRIGTFFSPTLVYTFLHYYFTLYFTLFIYLFFNVLFWYILDLFIHDIIFIDSCYYVAFFWYYITVIY